MDKIFGLPAHPFFVHAPLVLLPVVALAWIGVMLRPRWRNGLPSWCFPAAFGVLLVMTILATQSGEAFDKLVRGVAPIKKHQELAETTRLVLALAFVLSVVHGIVHWRSKPEIDSSATNTATLKQAEQALGFVLAVVAVIGTIWMIRTGHEGARLVWKGTK